jgi:hypothetical protein
VISLPRERVMEAFFHHDQPRDVSWLSLLQMPGPKTPEKVPQELSVAFGLLKVAPTRWGWTKASDLLELPQAKVTVCLRARRRGLESLMG